MKWIQPKTSDQITVNSYVRSHMTKSNLGRIELLDDKYVHIKGGAVWDLDQIEILDETEDSGMNWESKYHLAMNVVAHRRKMVKRISDYNDELRKRNRELKATVEELNQEVVTLRLRALNNTTDRSLEKYLELKTARINDLMVENDELKGRNANQVKAIESLRREVETLEKQIDSVKLPKIIAREREKMEKELNQLNEAIKLWKNVVSDRDMTINDLRGQIENLKQKTQFPDLLERNNLLRNNVEEWVNKYNELEQQYRIQKERLNNQSVTIEDLQEALNQRDKSYNANLQRKDEAIQELTDKLNGDTQEFEDMQQEIDDLTKENTILKRENERLEKSINAHKEALDIALKTDRAFTINKKYAHEVNFFIAEREFWVPADVSGMVPQKLDELIHQGRIRKIQ